MRVGDIVVLTAAHHKWLEGVGRWPGGKHVPRTVRPGVVTSVEGDGAVVVWWRDDDRTATHFADNLEVVE